MDLGLHHSAGRYRIGYSPGRNRSERIYGWYLSDCKINRKGMLVGASPSFYAPIQEDTPKVVAIAVSTVIRMLRILPQMFLFVSIV